MRVILVVERKHLFPGLSPQGFLPVDAVNLDDLNEHLFFAERDFMEHNSHFKQIIPYLLLQRGHGDETRVLCYQRRTKHTEARLGGLWSVGFGGHIEPLDRNEDTVKTNGLVLATALREMEEETGLVPGAAALSLTGFINSDSDDVSSVHFGAVFKVDLDGLGDADEAILELVSSQSEPHQALWIPARELVNMTDAGQGPSGGSFENWSVIAVSGSFGT